MLMAGHGEKNASREQRRVALPVPSLSPALSLSKGGKQVSNGCNEGERVEGHLNKQKRDLKESRFCLCL